MGKRVAVIGAGPAGVVAVKELIEEGHDPICFERAAELGGVFRYGEDGVIWETCRLTSSGLLIAFSDFPVSPHDAGHMSARDYVAYLKRYCDAFGVMPRIQFGTVVESVAPDEAGGWSVRTVAADGVQRATRVDAVAVCSGLNQRPHLPAFPGQDTFSGAIIHSSQYRRAAQVRGKRVLVIGGGESGADIVAEVSGSAAETVLSLRRGVAVVRRRPTDYRLCRIFHSAAHWMVHTRNPADDRKRLSYFAAFLPFVVADKIVQTGFTIVDEGLLLARRARESGDLGVELKVKRLADRLLAESGGTFLEQFGTKTADFLHCLATGICRRAGAIDRFDGSRVRFQDGTEFEPDLVIMCTGFEVTFPFLGEPTGHRERYLHTFDPSLGPRLAFIGFLRPAHGAIPPLAELQARWFAQQLSGAVPFPAADDMRAHMRQMIDTRRHLFRAVRGRLDHLVDYTSFSDQLAARIGCKPTRSAIRCESRLFRRRFFGAPFVSAQYRLVGPHAKPDIARQVITALPPSYPAPMMAILYMRRALSRLSARLWGPAFAPKLELEDGR